METLSGIEKDILKEMFSFGLAKSADSLSVISKESVYLNIPAIEILDLNDVISYVRGLSPEVAVIRSTITGDIDGETMLVFTQGQSDRLARICIGDPAEFEGNYLALKHSLLLELGNILTGTLVTQIANILKLHILGTPPELVKGSKRYNFEMGFNKFKESKPLVLTVNTEFQNSKTVIQLPFFIIFEMATIEHFLTIINHKHEADEKIFSK